MGCGCGKKKKVPPKPFDVMGGYKYLTKNQITKRLDTFKKMYCRKCTERYNCNFEVYQACTKRPQNTSK